MEAVAGVVNDARTGTGRTRTSLNGPAHPKYLLVYAPRDPRKAFRALHPRRKMPVDWIERAGAEFASTAEEALERARVAVGAGGGRVLIQLGEFDEAPTGDAIERALTFLDKLPRNSIALNLAATELLRSRLGADCRLVDLGNYATSGGHERLHLFLAEGEKPPQASALARDGEDLFLGRHEEIAEVLRAFEQARILMLTGPAGIGKSALSRRVCLELEAQFPDGIHRLSLARQVSPLPEVALARLLDVPGEPALERIAHAVGNRAILVVLDDVEENPTAATAIVDAFGDCLNLGFLLVGQLDLELRWARAIHLHGLACPPENAPLQLALEYDAAALFWERARQVNPAFQIRPEDAASLVGICGGVEGNPYALLTLADRTRTMTLPQILGRVEQVARMGRADELSGDQTLREVMEANARLMHPDAVELLTRLGAFEGAFLLDEIPAVLPDKWGEGRTQFAVEQLRRWSYLAVAEVPWLGRVFYLPSTVRSFAREGKAVVLADARKRHAHWLRTEAPRWLRGIDGPDQAARLARLQAALPDFERAVHDGLKPGADFGASVQLILDAASLFLKAGHYAVGLSLTERLLSRALAIEHPATPRLLNFASILLLRLGRMEESRRYAHRAICHAKRTGDPLGLLVTASGLAHNLSERGRYRAARRAHYISHRCAKQLSDPRRRQIGNTNLLMANLILEDEVRARALVEEGTRMAAPDDFVACMFWTNVSHVERMSGNLPAAADALRRAADLTMNLDPAPLLPGLLRALAALACEHEDYGIAKALWLDAQEAQGQAPLGRTLVTTRFFRCLEARIANVAPESYQDYRNIISKYL